MKRIDILSGVLALLAAVSPCTGQAIGDCGPIRANPHPADVDATGDGHHSSWISQLLNDVEILPALSIGMVRNDRLFFARGFGFGNLENCSPATPQTGYYLLSTTKSFTGMLGALLHHESALQMENVLTDFFPGLQLPAPINPGQVTLRQLLTHGQPFSNGGLNFIRSGPGEIGRDRELAILSRYSRPKPPTFEYSNTAYYLAGLIFEEATGQSWRRLMEDRVFRPLGMLHSTAHMERALQRDFAQRYTLGHDGGIVAVPNKSDPQMHPAGGAVSTVRDLSRWVIANLNQGRVEGRQVLPRVVVRQALAPQIQLAASYQAFQRHAYGLGVYHGTYADNLLVHHYGGAIHVSFMPEHGLGVIVLANNVVAGSILSHRIAALVYDSLLGKDDFSARLAQARDAARKSVWGTLDNWAQRKRAALERGDPGDPEVPASELEGRYVSDRLGAIEIYLENERLLMRYGALAAELDRLDGDSFTALFDDLDWGIPQVLDFRIGGEARVLDWDGREFVRN